MVIAEKRSFENEEDEEDDDLDLQGPSNVFYCKLHVS